MSEFDFNRSGTLATNRPFQKVTATCQWCRQEFSYVHHGKDNGVRRLYCSHACRMRSHAAELKKKKE